MRVKLIGVSDEARKSESIALILQGLSLSDHSVVIVLFNDESARNWVRSFRIDIGFS